MYKMISEIIENKNAFLTLFYTNIKTTVASTRLGFIWLILDPIVMMAIYYFLVRVVFNRGGENYHLFVFCGIVIWQCFSRTIKQSSGVITANSSLIKQIGFPLSIIVSLPTFVQLVFAVIGVTIIAVWNYSVLNINSLSVILLLLLLAYMSYGFSLFLSVIEVYFKDSKMLVGYIIRAGFFMSPILYPVSRIMESPSIPELIKQVYQLNPLVWIITSTRSVLLDGMLFDYTGFIKLAVFSFILVEVGLFFLRRNSVKLLKVL
jgi:lipopolysaccharide transport system permease protein